MFLLSLARGLVLFVIGMTTMTMSCCSSGGTLVVNIIICTNKHGRVLGRRMSELPSGGGAKEWRNSFEFGRRGRTPWWQSGRGGLIRQRAQRDTGPQITLTDALTVLAKVWTGRSSWILTSDGFTKHFDGFDGIYKGNLARSAWRRRRDVCATGTRRQSSQRRQSGRRSCCLVVVKVQCHH